MASECETRILCIVDESILWCAHTLESTSIFQARVVQGSLQRKPLDFKAWFSWQCFYARCYFSVWGGQSGGRVWGQVVWLNLCVTDEKHLYFSVQRLKIIPRILRYLLSTRFVTADVDLNHSVYAVSLRDSYFFTKIKIIPQHENNSSNIEDWDSAMALELLECCVSTRFLEYFSHTGD